MNNNPLPLRPPAAPLITHDPYFSYWSCGDRITDGEVKHWTGADYGLSGIIRVDGQSYRIVGRYPTNIPALRQTRVHICPTRTIYEFEDAGIALTLTFLSPLLPHDLTLMARPVSYVTWDVRSTDGLRHDVEIYFHATAQGCVDSPTQKVLGSRYRRADMELLRIGSVEQPVLDKAGDHVRIDWGYLYLALPTQPDGRLALCLSADARQAFTDTGEVPESDAVLGARQASDGWPVLACSLQLGSVGSETVSRHLLLAYDDLFSLEYMHRKLRPYWHIETESFAEVLSLSVREYGAISKRCSEFDTELMTDLRRVGGEEYAQVASLAFRQCTAAHKLAVDIDGSPIYFSKENDSNGCINTVDVTYPSSPFFLLFNPELLKSQITAILKYARSNRWPFVFAPHDLGVYPKANGQVYGGGEKSEEDQMPVEECGNMLLLVAVLVQVTGNVDYAEGYWPLLRQWTDYLCDKGLDPENQLCTDDFAGHLAHNVNLSLKAILAIGAFAELCIQSGHPEDAKVYRATAQRMAAEWLVMADAGDRSRLTFDNPASWSQKYNLVWDEFLSLNLFPKEIAAREVAYYLTQQNEYGLPLDSRGSQTKLDWIVWSATLAQSQDDFEALVAPVYRFANETTSRVPLTDWYDTVTGKTYAFKARSVVGGVYIKMLFDPSTRTRWNTAG